MFITTYSTNDRLWHNPDRPRSPRSGRYRVISGLNAPRERLCCGIVPNDSRVVVPWEWRHQRRGIPGSVRGDLPSESVAKRYPGVMPRHRRP
jgi:hypothetical protein